MDNLIKGVNINGTIYQVDFDSLANKPDMEGSLKIKDMVLALPRAYSFKKIAYGNVNGVGRFISIEKKYYSDTMMYSDNGTDWILSSMPSYKYWSYFTYGIVNGAGRFVAITHGTSSNPSNTAAYSDDGVNWVQTELPESVNWSYVFYGNNMFIAFTSDSESIAYSYDGITWNSSSITGCTGVSSACYGEVSGRGMFVAGCSDVATIFYSYNGIDWNTVPIDGFVGGPRVAYGNGIFSVVDSGLTPGASSTSRYTAYSYDGISWTVQSFGVGITWSTCLFCKDLNMFILGGSSQYVAYSYDGITYTESAIPEGSYGNKLFECEVNGKSAVAAFVTTYTTEDDHPIYYSYNGIDWANTYKALLNDSGEDVVNDVKDALGVSDVPDVGASNIETYSTLEQLGITYGEETIDSIVNALTGNSLLIYDTGESSNGEIYPSDALNTSGVAYGTCIVIRRGTRVSFEYIAHTTSQRWVGSYYIHSTDGGWSGWNKLYSSIDDVPVIIKHDDTGEYYRIGLDSNGIYTIKQS